MLRTKLSLISEYYSVLTFFFIFDGAKIQTINANFQILFC